MHILSLLCERTEVIQMQISHPTDKKYTTQNKPDTVSYRKKFFALVGLLFIIKLFLAFVLELGNDEAYYWFYSQYWQWNYFDHPPIVAVWIRLFTANLLLDPGQGRRHPTNGKLFSKIQALRD